MDGKGGNHGSRISQMFQLGRPISLTIYVEYRQHSDSLTQFQLADGALLPTVQWLDADWSTVTFVMFILFPEVNVERCWNKVNKDDLVKPLFCAVTVHVLVDYGLFIQNWGGEGLYRWIDRVGVFRSVPIGELMVWPHQGYKASNVHVVISRDHRVI